MHIYRTVFSVVFIVALLMAVGGFVYYALNIYQSNGTVACHGTTVAKQTDVAIHVIRQWFGREANIYSACPK